MKATIEFDLDDPSDRKAHRRCANATNAFLALHDIDNMLRNYTKYRKEIDSGDVIYLPDEGYELNSCESDLLHRLSEIIRFKVSSIIQHNGVNMDDLE